MRPGQRGSTLPELLAVTALLGLALAALLPVLWIAGQSWQRADRDAEGLQNARRAADRLVRDLRAAQSVQQVSPTLRFAWASDDATGSAPIVEYRLNGTELEYRVYGNFFFRQRMTVTAGTAVPAGYSVVVQFDHAALVAAGKSLASGDDVRVLYWNGTRWIELDRFRDVPSAWNSATTRIWFRVQAALPAGGSDGNYYLHYGDLSAGPPPANGDHVFLDYEDGTTLAGWTRRDSCVGTYAPSSADGFVFQASTGKCHRELSKSAPHNDVEIFWGFWGGPSSDPAGLQAGMSARRSETGVGYAVIPADSKNSRLTLRYWTGWSPGESVGQIATVNASITPGANYYARFNLVGAVLRAKHWASGTAEPAWMLQTTDTSVASGALYGQVDGFMPSADHRHRTIILRSRVADPEPTVTRAAEESGMLANAFQPLAGPFRALGIQCFDAAGAGIACTNTTAVRAVAVALTVMDPTGEVADYVVTARGYRRAP